MGVAVADYDNDGDQDIFVAGVNRNVSSAMMGSGRFDDVTEKGWSLDSHGANVVGRRGLARLRQRRRPRPLRRQLLQMEPRDRSILRRDERRMADLLLPDRYEGLPNQLFRNDGDGTFTDVSSQSGMAKHIGKGMGVAVADYDNDGFVDIFVANDTLPNFLFRNNGRGGFEEVGLAAGVAVKRQRASRVVMGVDFRDYDTDGLPDLIVSALEGETHPLFKNLGKGFFADATWQSGLQARPSNAADGVWDFSISTTTGSKTCFTANVIKRQHRALQQSDLSPTEQPLRKRKRRTFLEDFARSGRRLSDQTRASRLRLRRLRQRRAN